MTILFDTSVLVAALVGAHPEHQRCLPWLQRALAGELSLVLSAHSLAELYAVLTKLPLKPRISPPTAARMISENLRSVSKVYALDAEAYWALVEGLGMAGESGGIVYDAIIARVAEELGVEHVLTLNVKHFRRVWRGDPEAIIAP